MKSELWAEKYRPTRLGDMIGQDSFRLDAEGWIEHKDMPHLLLFGPAGVGKTAAAMVLAAATGGGEGYRCRRRRRRRRRRR